ncbi:hypothetical protein DPEC_G00232550 [Dallia pectoralis]|uniref:Uncharacterized protein n=1 Tax=Dallia pectoralis TaxID=75939 RepID=A0ACC2FXI5_DALPE|nr:hypothetical protein DPEC_G00232550 [Dallia pectoralis]
MKPFDTLFSLLSVPDLSQEQRSNSVAVAGAVMGAVLALFLIAVFTIVVLTARKTSPPAYSDKVIDLPPTHKPPPPYVGRPPAIPLAVHAPQVAILSQPRGVGRRFEMAEKTPTKLTHREPPSPSHQPLSYQEWVCHRNGADRVYINHQEHYV